MERKSVGGNQTAARDFAPPQSGRSAFFLNEARIGGYQGLVTKERDEFESAWSSYKERLHAWITGQMSPWEDADGTFQEVWLGYLRAIERGRAPRSPRAWLFTAARRLVVKGRRRRAMQALGEEPAARTPPPGITGAEAAIERLSPTAREVFILRVHMGLTYDEIAQVLEIPRGTVASRLHDAVTTLRRHLMTEGYRAPKWKESR